MDIDHQYIGIFGNIDIQTLFDINTNKNIQKRNLKILI